MTKLGLPTAQKIVAEAIRHGRGAGSATATPADATVMVEPPFDDPTGGQRQVANVRLAQQRSALDVQLATSILQQWMTEGPPIKSRAVTVRELLEQATLPEAVAPGSTGLRNPRCSNRARMAPPSSAERNA